MKDIVLELVSDNDVMSDKIGVTTFYWSFPSEAVNKVALRRLFSHFLQRKKDIEKYSEEVKSLKRRREELEEDYPNLKQGREETVSKTHFSFHSPSH